MNIFIVNNSKEACGVYQYGKRFANIACKSVKYNFMYFELDSEEEFSFLVNQHNPEAIIYNYLGGTLPWVTPTLVQKYREKDVKQYLIVHNTQFSFFDYYLHQNPYHKNIDNHNFSLARPLIDYQNIDYKKNNDILQIGTFGFGLTCKHIPEICSLINEQLFDKKVQINLHLTEAYYSPNADTINSIEKECLDKITHDNIKLNVTRNFLSDKEMLDFLYQNDLNIFFYENYSFYNGISSSVDYALSVKKPIAICKSNMFSHIWDVEPSICVEDNSLLSIINNGFAPLEEKYNSWTNDKFLNILESIIEKTTDNKNMNFNSDAKQDEFVANILNFKNNGYCVDIGSYHSVNSNNTYCFQEKGWTSISVEIDSRLNESYSTRKSGVHLNENALNVDYKKVFEEYEFPKSIDYLSLDVDTFSTSVLNILPLKEYRFKVITIEHDGYLYGNTYREEQRNILSSHGYQLVCSNVYVEQSGFEGKQCPFEDWWVDPSEFDEDLINEIKSENEYPSNIIQKFKK
jgi:hypothetical protein